MIFLVSPDSDGRLDLRRVTARDESYAVGVGRDGVITLTPSVVIPRSELDAMIAIRPVLSPDEVFGFLGSVEAAQVIQANAVSRRNGDRGVTVSTADGLHDLIWGDAA